MSNTIPNLSKSRYLSGLQCKKKLYYDLFRSELRPPVSADQQRLFDAGHEIGTLAQTVFPGGKDASPATPGDFKSWLSATQDFLTAGVSVIYEAAFSAGRVFAAMDILAHVNGERWAIEVKSSTSVKEYHLDDASLQYYVMKLAGYAPDKVFIMHIDNTYVLKGDLDPSRLLKLTEITSDVLSRQEKVVNKLNDLFSTLDSGTEPSISIGPHCSDPFECTYKYHCWKHVPSQSVFDLLSARGKEWELYEDGILEIAHIPDDYALSEKQRMQVQSIKSGEAYMDSKAISTFLEGLEYPLYFFDFETIFPVVPILDGTRPFEQVPFQYSVHVVKNEEGEIEHKEFLAPQESFRQGSEIDPRKLLIEQLKKDIGANGSIIAYNSRFEMDVIKSLAKAYPADALYLNELLERFKDLWVVFRSGWYYHPKMQSSTSIKSVLPALIENLDYSDLVISNGGLATAAFQDLISGNNTEDHQSIRQALLSYCYRDTEAMLLIWRKLKDISENGIF